MDYWLDDWDAAMGNARRASDFVLENSDHFLDMLKEECRHRHMSHYPISVLYVSNIGLEEKGVQQSHVFGEAAFDDGSIQDFQIIFYVAPGDPGGPPQANHMVMI